MKVIITTGGTGGHIYPALSLANELIKGDLQAEILFVGTNNHMEATIIPEHGYNFLGIEAEGIRGSTFQKIKKALKLMRASNKLTKTFRSFQPDVVIGFGGYASVPAVFAAKRIKCPIVLHEQNSLPGKANLFLARYAQAIIVCYHEAYNKFPKNKTFQLGNPRSSEVLQYSNNKEILRNFDLDPTQKTILIVMGSQGSESVNTIMYDALVKMDQENYQALFVTGKKHYQEVLSHIQSTNKVKIVEYINQAEVMAVIDLIIARGGATTAAEITALGTPSIIIPSPYVPNNHQVINTQALVEYGCAIMIEEKDLTSERLLEAISSIINDDAVLESMSKQAIQFSTPHATQDIIGLIKDIVGQ